MTRQKGKPRFAEAAKCLSARMAGPRPVELLSVQEFSHRARSDLLMQLQKCNEFKATCGRLSYSCYFRQVYGGASTVQF